MLSVEETLRIRPRRGSQGALLREVLSGRTSVEDGIAGMTERVRQLERRYKSHSEYVFMGDEHGCVMLPQGTNGLEVGSVVTRVTPHCDPTVNLFDWYHCVRGDTLIDIWPVDTRGRTWRLQIEIPVGYAQHNR